MDIFEDNYFDIIALPPSTNQCIQPSDYIPSDACLYHQDEFNNEWRSELPCYAELKPFTPHSTSSSSSSSLMSMTELDQFLIFEGDDTFTVKTFDTLPSKTLMCTDECSAFLTESSEILRVNSLKIQQQDEESSTASVVMEEIKCDEKVFFTCNFGDCKKTYSKPAHLRAHLRRHLGLKPFNCNFPSCSWKFSRSDELGMIKFSFTSAMSITLVTLYYDFSSSSFYLFSLFL
jgi:hypothetical protein